jgi:hypothetical protein
MGLSISCSMGSSNEGQSKSEIIVVDSDWPSGLLDRGHLGTPLMEDNRKQRRSPANNVTLHSCEACGRSMAMGN